jgi:hypothetical protein
MMERQDRRKSRPGEAAAHRAGAADREHVERLCSATGKRPDGMLDEGSVLRLGLQEDRLGLEGQRGDHGRPIGIVTQGLQQRHLPVQCQAERRGPGAGESQGVGGTPDRGPARERPRHHRLPGDERQRHRGHLCLDGRPDEGTLVDRVDQVGCRADLALGKDVRQPVLVDHAADVAVPAEGSPVPGGRRVRLERCGGARGGARGGRGFRGAEELPRRVRGLLLEHLRGAHHRPDGRDDVAGELPEEPAPVGIRGLSGLVGHGTAWRPGVPRRMRAIVSTG